MQMGVAKLFHCCKVMNMVTPLFDAPKPAAMPGTTPEDAAKEQAALDRVGAVEQGTEDLLANIARLEAENVELRDLLTRALAAADAAQGQ